MLKLLRAFSIGLFTFLLLTDSALASPSIEKGDQGNGLNIRDTASQIAIDPPHNSQTGGVPKQRIPVYSYRYIPIQDGPDGWCTAIGYTTDKAEADASNAAYDRPDTPAEYKKPCAVTPSGPATRSQKHAQITTTSQSFMDSVVLTNPVVTIQPGYGITGKKVFLQISGDQSRSYEVANPIGDDVTIDENSDYEINWDDKWSADNIQTTSSQGGVWPNGDVNHVYTHKGDVNIVVTQHWYAVWHSGDMSGELNDLKTASSIPNFKVKEVQAVLIN